MKLSGHTKPFAVLGHPIGHSLSPVMHNAAFESLGVDAVYLALDVHPDNLLSVLPSLRDMGFGGVNLTVPLKEVAFNGLSELDESARRLGAVNTVQFLADGTIRGHNTDGDGFLTALQEAFGVSVAGLSILFVGTGGAGRAVALTCAAQGAGRIAVGDIEQQRAEQVADEIGKVDGGAEVEIVTAEKESWQRACGKADLVVQCTPVGMKEEDPSPLDADAFRRDQMVYDLIYMFPETSFMKAAKKSGARTANGLGMLLHQGARAFSIWTGRQAAVEAMRKALEREVYGK